MAALQFEKLKMKYVLILVALGLTISLAWLPFELEECDRLLVENGADYFCFPIGFFAVPILSVSLIIIETYMLLTQVFLRKK
ncbi:MAG: hypothetical protein ABJ042_10895 [Lentilitoribacter sp.]